MKLAVDACTPMQLVDALRDLGLDVVSAAGRPRLPDEDVLANARAAQRVLVTCDKDFGDLVFRDQRASQGVILIRFDIVTLAQAAATAQRIALLGDDASARFTVLDADKARDRPLPPR
ncbi:MAG TPA: DUF5615 family PIN-like protein [Caulobacterales bacterium]|jgi:predicted nuclease of predicted toxin-antitoxin system|nr:DUF5615 family PIN-like protein [Caulobacterales bacterium]